MKNIHPASNIEKNESLFEVIKSNKIASKTANAFLFLGSTSILCATQIKFGISLIGNPDLMSGSTPIFLGMNGIALITSGFFTTMKFADLAKTIDEQKHYETALSKAKIR